MTTWDRITAPVLRAMESNAKWLDYHARNIKEAVSLLPARPDFETNAEAELAQTEADLAAALDSVRQARAIYASKAVEMQAAE